MTRRTIERIVGIRKDNILGDGIGYVMLEDWMGGDDAVVRRARKCYQSQDNSTPESDRRVRTTVITDKPMHGTISRGTVFTFDILAPLFVVRQNTRHLIAQDSDGNDVWHTGGGSFDIGGAYDEQSFRYTDKIAFYVPPTLTDDQHDLWVAMCAEQGRMYNELRSKGVAKQLARSALGPHVYSQYELTINTQALLDFLGKRLPGGGAQSETTKYATAMLEIARECIPEIISLWEANR